MDFAAHIAEQLSIRVQQASAAIELLDSQNTIPFISRYRKEATGGLDEEQLRQLSELLDKLRALEDRREVILKSILEQDKLSPELEQQIRAATTLTALEDLYQPYKPKRRTRAMAAREKGLQGLADIILEQVVTSQTMDELAAPYVNENVPSVEDAWAGARDIVAETISDHAEVRSAIRQKALQWGSLLCEKIEAAEDLRGIYQLYYQLELRIDKLRPHQVLAINRGESDKVLRVKVTVPERDWLGAIETYFRVNPRSALAGQLRMAVADSAERLLLPAIERDVRRKLTEEAETHAIHVFAQNLRALLNQPPLAGHTVLGIDPGFRTGCKVAVVGPTGKLYETTTIYPHEPQKQREKSIQALALLVERYQVTLITIGNGTASRETEQLVVELIRAAEAAQPAGSTRKLKYLIVNEAGASVYSASPLARAEFPDLDVSLRGAASIARRIQDPLAELVKIDPKSIGVGMYQHDVDQKQLAASLAGVVESVVNQVGVDVNTASPALLTYVAGIGPKLAERIVSYRDENGAFPSRAEVRQVPGLGPKAFEQAAGFLRVRDGENPLDASAIHPESYGVAQTVLSKAGLSVHTPPAERRAGLEMLLQKQAIQDLASELHTGEPTLADIFEQLIRPGRDPRQDLPAPILRTDVLKMEDLVAGMRLKGTVRNVVDFGAFIDIGVKQDGLLHRSQVPRAAELSVGDVIDVQILKVELERGRISLGWVNS
ncbi:MAG: RNA-binding transcriptional accessory protein [Anaerolineales bacterium]|nr:RNA-binding transcriptional accessory protein [Anaerolineales bacterium]